MLEKFRRAKEAEIHVLRQMAADETLPKPLSMQRPSLRRALLSRGPGAVIAEYKRASPSKGLINAAWTPRQAAEGYARAGAAALSVLTEEVHFQGSLDFLPVMAEPGLPVLRKDFLLHPLQVLQTAATPASALLLIARMLTLAELEAMLVACRDHGLEAVVEVFDTTDLAKAKAAAASIIQVNNRDLDKLTTGLRISEELIEHRASGEVWISASGMHSAEDMRRMQGVGYDGLLIGTRLMQETDPGIALTKLLEEMNGA
ncbi:indole-3-glycerol phosphate synthase [Desulfonatronum thiosulfatophilum]|uniref:indole-3-glycerol-phosphate synthase n=1 Tax=Desulfonatronum thiosulfatophilum TaxID=617002 RepID=A0A1G6B178_9BACT|nr:indole-3-glycerol-phosphate synthase [Desulfonatronum thiosulfatophilum]SDB14427.1 indole-3-glycerol phosphate synthase [Desulfonatronum thiosulfatophilum]